MIQRQAQIPSPRTFIKFGLQLRVCSKASGNIVTNTYHGKYVYRKRGILDDIPYRKLIRGAFIIQNKDKKQITDFLDRIYAEYYVRVVNLTEEDCEIMGLQIE